MIRMTVSLIALAVLLSASTRSSAQVIVSPSPYTYGPTVGPWFGPYYGPGFWAYGWGWNGSITSLPGVPWYGYSGIYSYGFAPTLGPTPGAFSSSGGYGIGGGIYGAQKAVSYTHLTLPTILRV